MKIEQHLIPAGTAPTLKSKLKPADLVLVFGSGPIITDPALAKTVADAYPDACSVYCSTAGEIIEGKVTDDSVAVTAVKFEKTAIVCKSEKHAGQADSADLGKKLAQAFDKKNLVHLLVFTEGLNVNGSDFVRGLRENLSDSVVITGGLAGDGGRFKKTHVGLNGKLDDHSAVGIGFYGSNIKIGHGSVGGWDPFGPERIITKSEGNILFELDGKSALELYKKYLGSHADGLPSSALLFPLNVRVNEETVFVRTILGIDEEKGAMIFAGDVPNGAKAQFMMANFDRLIDGASRAALNSSPFLGKNKPELAVLVSCVGRKMVLGERIEDEVAAVREVTGPLAAITGFYSYGEISPVMPSMTCELHNQTMTITTFAES